MARHWTAFGIRDRPARSARTPVTELPDFLAEMIGPGRQAASQPLKGITTDGVVRSGLYPGAPSGAPGAAITEAAQAFVDLLDGPQRSRLVHSLEADERRLWLNIHPNIMRHGLLLEDLSILQRNAAMGLMRTSLSARGFRQARGIMWINGLLADLTDRPDEFGEWPYWMALFGEPSATEPWGWQIDGHHLNLTVFVVGDRVSFTPAFMGSEPCWVDEGRLAGTVLFVAEQRAGVDLMRSLNEHQRSSAARYESIVGNALPPELQHPVDGRMVAGAFKDNVVIPYEGLRGDALSDAQRRLLRNLIGTYVGWTDDPFARVRMSEVDAHLDETHFSWMGSVGDEGPFYYRVHSPVVLIEFDHHPGVVFDNPEPTHHHIHTIMRTPNGGDYGADLLRQHHEAFDHVSGDHHAR